MNIYIKHIDRRAGTTETQREKEGSGVRERQREGSVGRERQKAPIMFIA